MIPFLHIGSLSIPTFGLMLALGLLVSAYVLQADFNRRREQLVAKGYLKNDPKNPNRDEGFLIIGIAGIAGILGAKLYHAFQDPDTWKSELFSRYGFAWFGGFLGGFIALVILARYFEIPILEFLDICAPAACVGYAIGRIGCLLSGDGDYGIPTSLPWGMSFPNGVVPTTGPWNPVDHSGVCLKYGLPESCTVHPTPIYEFAIWLLIAWVLWRTGRAVIAGKKSLGTVFCGYLIWTGVARFLVEYIRINPRTFFGMSNAQTASVISVAVGIILLLVIRPSKVGAAARS
jgi:phosphatidylglycerol---prolipoprotein diacylglyceryl transferase